MQNIIIEASEVWDYCEENNSELIGAYFLVAENQEYGMQVWVTTENDFPEIIVEADNDEVYRKKITDREDAEKTANEVYEDYLSIRVVETMSDTDDNEELIEERENELNAAVMDFVSAAADSYCYPMEDEMVEELKEHFLEYMYRKYGIEIRRPMHLEDVDTGEEYFTEYPYEDMVFDNDSPEIKGDSTDNA